MFKLPSIAFWVDDCVSIGIYEEKMDNCKVYDDKIVYDGVFKIVLTKE